MPKFTQITPYQGFMIALDNQGNLWAGWPSGGKDAPPPLQFLWHQVVIVDLHGQPLP